MGAVFSLIVLVSSQAVTFGTPARDTPVAFRVMEDGTFGVVLQSYDSGEMFYSIVEIIGNQAEITRLDTGLEELAWTRGCAWLTDDSFAMQAASWQTIEDHCQLQVYMDSNVPYKTVRYPVSGSLSSGPGEVSSVLPLPGDEGYFLTVDLLDPEEYSILQKILMRLTPTAEVIWSAEVLVEGWYMNPDEIRAMPDGGCVVASDEDGFSPLLHLSRFDEDGNLLWNVQLDTEGEMEHQVMDILPAPEEGTLVIASTDLFQMNFNTMIVMIDREGNIQSNEILPSEENLKCACGISLGRGGFLLAGWTGIEAEMGMSRPEVTPVLIKLDPEGRYVDMQILEGVDIFTEPRFMEKSGNSFYIAGACWQSQENDDLDCFVMETVPEI